MAELTNLLKINDNGISIPSFREVREALVEKWQEVFEGINLSSDTPDGHQVDLEARTIVFLMQSLQAMAANLSVENANGKWLDNIASLFGLTRDTENNETDAQLRIRIENARLGGFATYDGMFTYLQQELGVNVGLRVNDEPFEVDGIPAHSFIVYVPENTEKNPEEIGAAIWKCKPAGIRSYGSEKTIARDISEMIHDVYFSYIHPIFAKVRITITEYNEEELPTDYEELIGASVSDWAKDEFTAGKDVIPQRFIAPIYKVHGIDSVKVEVSIDNGKNWSENRIPIGNDGVVQVKEEDVEVIKD